MKLTVGQLLDLIQHAVATQPAGDARIIGMRRLAMFRNRAGNLIKHLEVEIPKPEMSEEAKETLKNSRKASSGRSRKPKPKPEPEPEPEVEEEVEPEPEEEPEQPEAAPPVEEAPEEEKGTFSFFDR